jgi:hypothetical protein
MADEIIKNNADLEVVGEGSEVDLTLVSDALIVNAVSPRATVTQTETGATITITDYDGVTAAEILNGEKGDKGDTPEISATASTLTPGSAATVEKTVDPETGAVNLAFGIPEGQQGGKGDTGKTPDISIGTVTTGAAGSDASATMTGTPENPVLNLTIPRGDKGKDGEDYILTAADKAEIAQQAEELLAPALDNKAPIIINSASGDIASFTDGADGLPVKQLTVNVEPVQSGSGDPSPDNVRPITGWAGANVYKTGKNLIGGITLANNIKANLARAIIDTDNKTVSYGYTATGGLYPVVTGKFKPLTQYTVIFSVINPTIARSNLQFVYSDGSYSAINLATVNTKEVIVATSVSGKTLKWVGMARQGGTTRIYYDESGIFEGVLTASDFEPYQGDTYDITFPSEAGTVYGGTLDVTGGVLTVDRANIASYNGETLLGKWISDRDVFAEGTAPTIGAQVVYYLSAPLTYQLTPQELTTLLGTNNIWADTGGTSVTYRADTKLFVEQNTPESPVQDVQVNGVSVVTDGVANVPIGANTKGVVNVSTNTAYGLQINSSTGFLQLAPASESDIKSASYAVKPIGTTRQHVAAFYGLAKAAGDTTQSASSNAVGTYTESAKSKISEMLNGSVTVTGTTPTITALAGVQYVCGEVSTLDITPPASGCFDVIFESGSTPTALNISNPTGTTVEWSDGFDTSNLAANTVYEINLLRIGTKYLGVAASWT